MLPDHQTLPDDPAGSQQIAALHQQYEQQLVQLNDENRLLREQIAQATDTAANATNDTEALNKLRQIIAARKAVELVTGWPDDRLKELTRSAAPRPFSLQRGGL